MSQDSAVAGSFRDPSGFVFRRNGVLLRQVNKSHQEHYDALMSSGLYGALTKRGFLVDHEEISQEPSLPEASYKIIKPAELPFISYPYEWCFSQLKDAALLTLEIAELALEHGLSLKDASAYNIQFHEGRPVFIDTLSLEKYEEGAPWVAYKQFCQHFLAPLALMAKRDVRLLSLLKVFIDGVPLDLASSLLPWKTRVNFGLLMHLHLHAKSQKRYENAGRAGQVSVRQIKKVSLLGLIDSLKSTVANLSWRPSGTEWGDYYQGTNYSSDAFSEKEQLVESLVRECGAKTVWDLGANTGVFSEIAAKTGASVLAFDIDPAAVEKSYVQGKTKNRKKVLPLLLDLTNPSPSLGWANEERLSIADRGRTDLVMALALIHHLAISNNVPLSRCAQFFARLGQSLIIEFVPKSDSQVQRLLASRKDIFSSYDQASFEEAFSRFFTIKTRQSVTGSARTLYMMHKKS